MSVVNPMITPLFNPNVKDSRWLTLEVCREFQRSKCSRTENECKFAHPPPHVEVQNGRVTCCFDSIKGKCQRKEPPCKYLHPPQHLREQLLQNGRNNLILRNLQMQYLAAGLQPTVMPGVFPTQAPEQSIGQNSASADYRASPNTFYAYEVFEAANGKSAAPAFPAGGLLPGQMPYLQVPSFVMPQNAAAFGGQYLGQSVGGMPGAGAAAGMLSVEANAAGAVPGVLTPSAKISRPDRLEPVASSSAAVSSSSSTSSNGGAVGGDVATNSWSNDATGGVTTAPHYSHVYLQQSSIGMVPMVKRPALDNKSGIPMYQPASAAAASATAYQQAALAAMQLQQQQFVPVSIAGHPPSVPRF